LREPPRRLAQGPTTRKTKSGGGVLSSLFSALFWFAILSITTLVAFQFLLQFSDNPPFLSFVVQSGSMEPSIMTGDIIVIAPQSEYRQNEAITFRGAQDRVITHRIKEVIGSKTDPSFITKGDANQETDVEVVPLDRVLGKVTMNLPKLGYFVTFGKSLYGIILLIVIPAAIVVVDELGNLIIAYSKKRR
jgi:signal peptidase